jgi:4-diphosphocytidyl-2-C-methyl-D-erythritol kinase
MQNEHTLYARPKINLYLEITGVREDGYHELTTLFHPLPGPVDELALRPAAPGAGLVLECDDAELAGPSNLVWKAWDGYAGATGFRPDVRCRLTKRIPSGAGLGGGSSDAAAMLRWLQEQAGEAALEPEPLVRLAAGLGADVAFFLQDGPAWAAGVGERLQPADVDLSGFSLVLVCPASTVNTAQAYREWDRLYASGEAKPAILTCAAKEDMRLLCPILPPLFNSLEPAVFASRPGLGRIKEELLSLGAAGAMMSGSGSSVFGLFRERSAAEFGARRMAAAGISATAHHF